MGEIMKNNAAVLAAGCLALVLTTGCGGGGVLYGPPPRPPKYHPRRHQPLPARRASRRRGSPPGLRCRSRPFLWARTTASKPGLRTPVHVSTKPYHQWLAPPTNVQVEVLSTYSIMVRDVEREEDVLVEVFGLTTDMAVGLRRNHASRREVAGQKPAQCP